MVCSSMNAKRTIVCIGVEAAQAGGRDPMVKRAVVLTYVILLCAGQVFIFRILE